MLKESRIPISVDTRKILKQYVVNNDFKDYDSAIINLLRKIEKK